MNLHSLTVGSGPSPVVFLHGLFGQGKNWGSIANALGTEATSHLIDLPNHGLSPWTETFELDQQDDHRAYHHEAELGEQLPSLSRAAPEVGQHQGEGEQGPERVFANPDQRR